MSKIIDTIEHGVTEEDAVQTPSRAKPTPACVKTASAPAPAPPPLVSASESAWSEESQRIYQKILAKTDFQSTAEGMVFPF